MSRSPDLLMATDSGITIGDLGYRGKKFQDLLIEEVEMLMLTRADATDRKKLLSQIQQIETTFSQLWLKFIDRVFSRSWLGLWNSFQPQGLVLQSLPRAPDLDVINPRLGLS